jgi:hypothetical protein
MRRPDRTGRRAMSVPIDWMMPLNIAYQGKAHPNLVKHQTAAPEILGYRFPYDLGSG